MLSGYKISLWCRSIAIFGCLASGACVDVEAGGGQSERGRIVEGKEPGPAPVFGVATATTSGGGQAPAPYVPWGWKASASSSAASGAADGTLKAFDGDIGTRWTTGRAQAGDESFVVDFGTLVPMSQIVLDDTTHPDEYPQGYRVEISDDGVTFTPVETGMGTTVSIVCFHKVTARYLRVCQTGAATAAWSIDELRVYP